jgi:hypothetical protein
MRCDICKQKGIGIVTIAQTKTQISICVDCNRHVTALKYVTNYCVVPAGTFDLEDWVKRHPEGCSSSASKDFQSAAAMYMYKVL